MAVETKRICNGTLVSFGLMEIMWRNQGKLRQR